MGFPLEHIDQMAASDGNDSTSHAARGIGCQQQQRAIEILELAEPALRNPRNQRLASIGLPEITVDVGI